MSARGGKRRQKSVSRSAKAGVLFPVGRMHRYLRRSVPKFRIGAAAPVYQAAVIEYLTGTEVVVNSNACRVTHVITTRLLVIYRSKHINKITARNRDSLVVIS